MRRNYIVLILLLLGAVSGCANNQRMSTAHQFGFIAFPVSLQAQWNNVFSVLALQELEEQKQILKELSRNNFLSNAEKDMQRALMLALGEPGINDVAMAVNIASEYQATQNKLSPQARFAITMVNNKQKNIVMLDALNSKLNALKNIEESMMGRGQ